MAPVRRPFCEELEFSYRLEIHGAEIGARQDDLDLALATVMMSLWIVSETRLRGRVPGFLIAAVTMELWEESRLIQFVLRSPVLLPSTYG